MNMLTLMPLLYQWVLMKKLFMPSQLPYRHGSLVMN
uniref:Uncharacterized protein n=1 Tax=Myotis myotis TaxID=51298 RepID=A0A7J8ARR6_MYOMY|nr:hypothetical protein mMyoMyo1_018593 [Myotis myotis]